MRRSIICPSTQVAAHDDDTFIRKNWTRQWLLNIFRNIGIPSRFVVRRVDIPVEASAQWTLISLF